MWEFDRPPTTIKIEAAPIGVASIYVISYLFVLEFHAYRHYHLVVVVGNECAGRFVAVK